MNGRQLNMEYSQQVWDDATRQEHPDAILAPIPPAEQTRESFRRGIGQVAMPYKFNLITSRYEGFRLPTTGNML